MVADATTPPKETLKLFCPVCFASEDGGSWGGGPEGEPGASLCSNCGLSNGAIRIPAWALKCIYEQMCWVGRRYYPDQEYIDQWNELQALRREMKSFPGRSARPVSDQPGTWWVEQATKADTVMSVMVQAVTAEEALAKAIDKLPWVKELPGGKVQAPTENPGIATPPVGG